MPVAVAGPQLPPDSSGKITGAFQVGSIWLPAGVVVDSSGNSASVFSPSSELRVALEGTQVFLDSFDSGLDTLDRWKPPSTGTGGIAATSVAGSGGTTLSSGSTLNGFSLLESQATFQASDPGWLYQRINLNIEFAVLTTGYRFWGRGQTPVTPTVAAPMNEAVGWEIRTDGKLYACMYASGSRTFNQDLSAATGSAKQPTDSSSHDYMVWFKGNYMYWAIDSPDNIVAFQTTGANGPNYNNMPIKLLCVSNSGTAVTLSINSIVLGDTGRNSVSIVDPGEPWKSATIEDSGAIRVGSGTPAIIQKKSAVSTGSVASLSATFDAINTLGNTIVVACAVGNVTTPTVTDTTGNTYTLAKVQAVGAAANVAIFIASGVFSGARNIITVNNGGATASIAMEAYEMDALLGTVTAVVDTSAAATATSTTPATAALSPVAPNEFMFFAVAVGTAAQTITPATGWSNDSGQLNPVTPAGLFSFASMSQFSGALASITPSSTIVSEPWAAVSVSLRPTLIGVQGSVRVTDGTTNVTVKAPSIAPVATDAALVVAVHPGGSPRFKAATFRSPGIAGTVGQKIAAIHNATGSTKVVKVRNIVVTHSATVVTAVTVLPPIIRIWKVTVLPTNGTAITKVPLDSAAAASSGSITVFNGASADGTSSGTALTATLPAGTILEEAYAPRIVTGAGQDSFGQVSFLQTAEVTLNALEGVVVFLDYVLATQNAVTDMWTACFEWSEA